MENTKRDIFLHSRIKKRPGITPDLSTFIMRRVLAVKLEFALHLDGRFDKRYGLVNSFRDFSHLHAAVVHGINREKKLVDRVVMMLRGVLAFGLKIQAKLVGMVRIGKLVARYYYAQLMAELVDRVTTASDRESASLNETDFRYSPFSFLRTLDTEPIEETLDGLWCTSFYLMELDCVSLFLGGPALAGYLSAFDFFGHWISPCRLIVDCLLG